MSWSRRDDTSHVLLFHDRRHLGPCIFFRIGKTEKAKRNANRKDLLNECLFIWKWLSDFVFHSLVGIVLKFLIKNRKIKDGRAMIVDYVIGHVASERVSDTQPPRPCLTTGAGIVVFFYCTKCKNMIRCTQSRSCSGSFSYCCNTRKSSGMIRHELVIGWLKGNGGIWEYLLMFFVTPLYWMTDISVFRE